MFTEGIESRLPELAVWRQPGVELGQRVGVELVHTPLRLRSNPHEPGVAQHTQVLRGPGLAQTELADELIDGPGPLAQELDRGPAMRVRQR
jgi:hypothetical protein